MMRYARKTDNDNYINGGSTEERIAQIMEFGKRGPFTVNQLWSEFKWPINSIRRICIGLFTRNRLRRQQVRNNGIDVREYLYELPQAKMPRNPEKYWAAKLRQKDFASENIMPESPQRPLGSLVFRQNGYFPERETTLPQQYGTL